MATLTSPPIFSPAAPGDRAEDRLVAVVTEALVRRGRTLAFAWHTWRVRRTLRGAEGLVMFALRIEWHSRRAWTVTVWRDAAAVAAFYGAPPHRRAIERSGLVLERFRSRRAVVSRGELPIPWSTVFSWLPPPADASAAAPPRTPCNSPPPGRG